MVDEKAVIIRKLSKLGIPVYSELPHDFEEKRLPALWIQHVGPAARRQAINSMGIDYVDLDIDLFVSLDMWHTGAAMELAQEVRAHVHRFREGMLKVLDAGRPIARPDFNSVIRRYGLTITVAVPA
ncbi:hypothetical protein [Corynebacterium phage LGCM-V6]|uniref:hypothetical protein n=1 Tax=Corynebacterium pseudotuberculosis TaxID=1719 RepID=UPI000655D627|nr:hypothetical protein [Corynebacterium pseudotuberculosis]AQY55160.1 hypothetical protein LGCMVI_0032 [Corynebacterium phage LGCM-VI]ARM68564.1 hypothetical protein [Corynebacterium phage LGCM-V2]ARM68612.1 hypothetical protein [Corynebacterium phage LGCM-V3]ARM68661.1 hypothetical protein [Corynebacterium phage LGCM-V4]ARM68709.1 hypothetical protein [Corynebacterium phage LGCM-V6]ARM68757.1 hypothetical protein [Corynebacterium phage LGCM-V5]ARM68805.1 hypothetical protein [Corynebacteri